MKVSMQERVIAVYVMANRKHGKTYVGVTSDLVRRVFQHREDILPGDAMRHGCKDLVWYEVHGTIDTAITRENKLSRYRKKDLRRLIEERNPDWKDLWPELMG